MRLFVGIRIPGDIAEKICGLTAKLAKKVKEAKTVKPENLHITLKFLGEVEEEQLAGVGDVLGGAARNFKPFDITIGGVGGFPEGKKIRVLWVGADSGGRLRLLNREIENKIEALGFSPDRRFKEHITIARFKTTPCLAVIDGLKASHIETIFGVMRADHIELIKSTLTSAGPVYDTLLKFPFSLSPEK